MAYTTINKSSLHMNTKLYTGNGSTQSITGVGFQPDFTWIKPRSQAEKHSLTDAVRGAGKVIQSDTTVAEFTNTDYISSFISDGFSIGSNFRVNTNSTTYASWNWKANGSGSANTDGSISSTVSVNTTAGFSIVTVSKPNTSVATIGHGLGVTPKFIIGKDLDGVDNWTCYNEALGNGKGIYLNATNAEATASTFWNSTSPTSTLFTIGSDNTWNSPSIVFYCFADVPSFSKFGTYTGNGNADGPFVYTGFKPAFIIVKDTSTGASWPILDATISSSVNPLTGRLYTDGTNAIGTSVVCDTLSNGFKMRNTLPNCNASGNLFIYIAFAENPFVTSTDNNSIPTTAR